MVILKVLRNFFIRKVKIKKIRIEKGKGDLEKTSKKKPPKTPASKPKKLEGGFKKLIKTTKIKIRFKGNLKKAKKLI